MNLSLIDYTLLGIILLVVGIILGSYSLFIFFLLRRRKEKALYGIIFSSITTHFAMWGVAEFYFMNEYWYFIGMSVVQTIDKVYWALAWFGCVIPIAIGFTAVILYFLVGYEETKETLKIHYLNLLDIGKVEHTLDTVKEIVSDVAFVIAGSHQLFDNESKKKIFFKSILATISGWGIGNIIQDRLSGLLSMFTLKPEYLPKFQELYWSFGGDLTAGLTQWILPILFITIISLIYIYKK